MSTTYAPPRPRTRPSRNPSNRRARPPAPRRAPRPSPRRLPMDPRLRDRRVSVLREAGRRRLRRVVWVLGTIAVAAAATGIVVSPILDVNQIAVIGVDGAHADEVRTATGVERGEALLLVDTGTATERVETLAWVEHVEISRELPGTLRVRITPRFPVAWRATDAGTIELIDRRGIAVTTTPTMPAGLPELQAGSPAEVRAAAQVASALGSELAPRVARVIVESGWGRLWLHSGEEVRLGDVHRELGSKLRAAVAILETLAGATVNYLSVEVPSAPTTG